MKLLIFFILVFFVYHIFSHKLKFQNTILVISSTLFYSWFEWKYTFLIWGYIVVNFFSGIIIQKLTVLNKKRFTLICTIALNLGILAIFKYHNFFSESIISTLSSLGISAHPFTVEVIFPVGISFYCFQCISYISDVYRKTTKAEENLLIFSAFVLFFPQLAAGPIQRANNLIPQFHKSRNVSSEDMNLGLWAIVWGIFNKVVIADTCIMLANTALNSDSGNQGALTYLGTLAFGIGIYADFNGYSLIAIGTAKLLGFNLAWNFTHPYGAKSIVEFWQRWHISLSQWLKDYLYIPLGGNKKGFCRTLINLILVMAFCGIWHGSTLNYFVWGVYHGMLLSLCHIWRKVFKNIKIPRWLGWAITQIVVFFGWYLFAVPADEWSFNFFKFELTYDALTNRILILTSLFSMILFIVGRLQIRANDMFAPARLRLAPYSVLLASLFLAIFVKYQSAGTKFIYFQF